MIWPIAVVVVAALAWDVARRHIVTRRAVELDRIAALETKLAALDGTGQVLKNLNTRLAGVERAVKAALVSDE